MACIKAIHSRSSVKGLVVETCDFCPLNSFRATVQFVSHRDMGVFFSFRHASRQNHCSRTIGLTSQWRRHTFFCGKWFTCWSDQESGCHFFPTRCFVYSVVLSLFQFPSLFIDILLASVRKWRNDWILSLSSAHKSCRQFQVWKLCRQVIFLLKYRKSTLIIHHPNLVICYIANKSFS